MRWSYDAEADALYVKLLDVAPVRQEVLADGTIVDLASDDRLVGVEVISAQAGGWDPTVLRDRFEGDAYDLRAIVVTALRLGVIRVAGGGDAQPAYRGDDALVGTRAS